MGHVPSSKGNSVKRQRLYIVPWNYWMPRMPNSIKMNSMKMTALSRELTEPTKDDIISLIFGNALILRRGRSTRKVRMAFILILSYIISMMPVMTTMKSSQFQASRRYALWCNINPWARILRTISIVKSIVRTLPINSSIWLCAVSFSLSL